MLGTCTYCGTEFRYNPANKTGKYCSNVCQQANQREEYIERWLSGGKKPGKIALQKYLTETHGYKCSCCGISDWQGKPIKLEIDHEDGNPYNDRPDNLRYICPNCHSQTPTYRGKNRGNGRVERRERAREDYHRQASKALR